MPYNPQMDKLTALQALTGHITNRYGGGNRSPKSVIVQNEAYVQGARKMGLTDPEIAKLIPGLPWNDSTRDVAPQPPMQGLMADELGPLPEGAIEGGYSSPDATAQATAAPAPMPAAPAQVPAVAAPQAQQAQPSFFQRLGQGFDRAATGGIIDPTTLTKDQRRILRGQLLMNIGGALSQNRPIGEGFQQQYNMLTKRQAEEQAKQIEATRKSILSNADISTKEGVMAILPQLAKAGLQDDLFKFANYAQTAFPNEFVVQQNDQGMFVINKGEQPFNPDGSFNPKFATLIPGTTPQPEGITAYQAEQIRLEQERNDIARGKAETAAKAKTDYNPLNSRDSTALEKTSAQMYQVDTAMSSFKPEYAGKTAGGELLMAATRVAPESITNPTLRDAAGWWASYGRYKNVVRNELFGASLTANEQKAFNDNDINPNMAPELIRRNLNRQQEILRVANARKGLTLLAGNMNPEQVSIASGIDFTGRENPGFPPEKWNSWTTNQRQVGQREFWRYMINPKKPAKAPSSAKPNPKDDALINKYLQ